MQPGLGFDHLQSLLGAGHNEIHCHIVARFTPQRTSCLRKIDFGTDTIKTLSIGTDRLEQTV